MSLYTVRPISDRTPFRGPQRNSPFTTTWSQARDLLYRELDFLDAHQAVLEVDVDEKHIRLDGELRTDAKARTGAVRLAFKSNRGELTYATDVFEKPSWRRNGMQEDWQHNLYAIAKGLEALRLVDRYGITQRGEQYTGFKALPGGRAMPPSHMTTEQAYDVLAAVVDLRDIANLDLDDALLVRRAKAAAHPDRNGGDRVLWDQVEQAARALGVDR